MIADYERFENNTNVLILLNGTVKSMLTCTAQADLAASLLFEKGLIKFFANRLNSADYK